jgi:DNA helicase II / ATP-dependent DNA helicase PcrA
MDINALPSVYSMENIEHHFKVFAGPGAGKTRWLVNHIERVLKESKRLHKTRKIACITYTNVAADEIKERLSRDSYRIEVSTIHSFLYYNLIKPFHFLIEKDSDGNYLVNTDQMIGNIEHIPRWDRVLSWIKQIEEMNGKRYYNLKDKDKIYKYFPTMDWFLSDGKCELKFRHPHPDIKVPTRNGELFLYKQCYWKYGILHHEDILYFSYYIFENYPETLEFIRARFPYIFVDEFQDTTQLQTIILHKIAQKDTIIGMVGDLAQSIYKFAGAQWKDFEQFSLPSLKEYKLEQNHRSSSEIIAYLNTLRTDIQQKKVETTTSIYRVTLLIGNINLAQKWIKERCPIDPIILTRNKSFVNRLKYLSDLREEHNLINQLYSSDQDKIRPAFIHSLLIARDYYTKDDNRKSIKEISKYLNVDKDEKEVNSLTARGLSINILEKVLDDLFLNKTIFEAYSSITKLADKNNIRIAAKYKTGNAKEFSEKYTLADLVPYIKVESNQKETIRTIHSAKGTEFECVLIYVPEEGDFRRWIVDCANQVRNLKQEEARIYYVAISRAKKYLFINIPELKDESNIYKEFNIVRLQ